MNARTKWIKPQTQPICKGQSMFLLVIIIITYDVLIICQEGHCGCGVFACVWMPYWSIFHCSWFLPKKHLWTGWTRFILVCFSPDLLMTQKIVKSVKIGIYWQPFGVNDKIVLLLTVYICNIYTFSSWCVPLQEVNQSAGSLLLHLFCWQIATRNHWQ